MKIAIIGGGRVGRVLGRRIAAAGHEMVFGSRTPASPEARAVTDELGARVLTRDAAVAWAELVLLTVPWTGAKEAVQSLGDLSSKILVDVTNPVNGSAELYLDVEGYGSGAEAVAAWARGGTVVKAFNTSGQANLSAPRIGGHDLPALLCGAPEATATVAGLARSMGFEPIVVGGLERAHLVEEAARLWITLAYGQGNGDGFAFVVARR